MDTVQFIHDGSFLIINLRGMYVSDLGIHVHFDYGPSINATFLFGILLIKTSKLSQFECGQISLYF